MNRDGLRRQNTRDRLEMSLLYYNAKASLVELELRDDT